MIKNRRGISEMIAVVLVMIIVSIAGIALYNYSLNSMSEQYGSFTETISRQSLASVERFEVVGIQRGVRGAWVFIYNYTPDETLTTTVSNVYVKGQNATWGSSSGGVLQRNRIVKIWVEDLADGTEINNDVKIIVVSTRGVGYAYP